MTIRRFFQTPKGITLLALLALLVVSVAASGFALVASNLVAAVIAAAGIDVVILRIRKGKWVFPSGAVLTGLFVAMILSGIEPWHVSAITSAIAVVSKYLFRVGKANVFNPAALALVVAFYLFGTAQNWWGALAEAAPAAVAMLVVVGVFITWRVNKVPVVVSFLAVYFGLCTLAAFLADPRVVAELYRPPDLQMALFFAFFMVSDPPTSPHGTREQLVYGVIVAGVGFAVFEAIGAAYFLLAGLLVANLWQASRRTRLTADS